VKEAEDLMSRKAWKHLLWTDGEASRLCYYHENPTERGELQPVKVGIIARGSTSRDISGSPEVL
jgi:hypothetical protein